MALEGKFYSGIPTVGNASSQGVFNPGTGEGAQDALRRCLLEFGCAYFMPGTHTFTAALTGDFTGCRIMGSGNSILVPVASGTTGLFSFTGNNIVLDGFQVSVPTYVASQNVIKMTGRNILIQGLLVDCTDSTATGFNGTPGPAAAHTSNEMRILSFDNATIKKIQNNTFFPNKGITCIYSQGSGAGVGTDAPGQLMVSGNAFRSKDQTYDGIQTKCWRCIDVFGDEYSTITGNTFFQLGDITQLSGTGIACTNATTLTDTGNGFGVFTAGDTVLISGFTGAGASTNLGQATVATVAAGTMTVSGLAMTADAAGETVVITKINDICDSVIFIRKYSSALVESGHINLSGNHIERICTVSAVKLWGVTATTFFGNNMGLLGKIGASYSVPALSTQGGILVTGQDGTSNPGTGLNSSSVVIASNEMHNLCGVGSGAFIRSDCSEILHISGNQFAVCASDQVILINAGTGVAGRGTERFHIVGNSFHSNSSAARAIRIADAVNILKGCNIAYNTYEGFNTSNALIADATNAGASGRRKILTGIQNTVDNNDAPARYSSTGVTVTGTNTFNDSNNGLAFLATGDDVLVSGSTGAGNNGIHRVTTGGVAGSIVVGTVLTNDASAGETVTFTKVNISPTTNVRIDA